MVWRLFVLIAASAAALALAACAETGGAMAASAAEQAAVIAATQATIATTQAIDQLETASTRMSIRGPQPYAVRGLPKLPPVRKGRLVIFTPDFIIVQRHGKRIIVRRENYVKDEMEGIDPNQ
jgi:hypothetical protein